MRCWLLALMVTTAICGLAACGNKGSLYLPEAAPPQQPLELPPRQEPDNNDLPAPGEQSTPLG